jgi:hypothetical protein
MNVDIFAILINSFLGFSIIGHVFYGNGFFWLICGATTGIILLIIRVFSTWKSVLALAFAWLFAVYAILVPIQLGLLRYDLALNTGILGAIGGAATGIILFKEKKITTWQSVLWVTAGWMIGGIVGSLILGYTSSTYGLYAAGGFGFLPNSAASSTIGAIGGFFTVWQIRETQRKRAGG